MKRIEISNLAVRLLAVTGILYPVGIYVVNDKPWNHIFMIFALLCSLGALITWTIDRSKTVSKNL